MSLISQFVKDILRARDLGAMVAHHEVIAPREAKFAATPEGLAPDIKAGLAAAGIKRLFTHQAEAISRILAGEDVVVVTPTASGKTVCYNAPVIARAAQNPDTRALYLFPIKALEQDQLGAFRELAAASGLGGRVQAEIYDGDTPSHRRKKIRDNPPSVVITNPDMLHVSLLGYHEKWETLLKSLEFIVLDEVHTYRGVFGTHVSHVLRRLMRLCELYGSSPRVIACSATIQNPGQLVHDLIGREVSVVDDCGAPSAGRQFIFINPQDISASTTASRLLRQAINRDLATIVFTKARKITELIYTWTIQADPRLAKVISAYRAGYLPEERREIEHQLFTGKIKGVVTTSALEMGIDIGALDLCVLVGYPGAITTTWQRGGRVGRQDRESLIAMVAAEDALDQYFMKHPRVFFESAFEPAIIDPTNRMILKSHLECAAHEIPLTRDDKWFNGDAVMAAIDELTKEGLLLKTVDEEAWHARRKNPQREVSLRGIGESSTIFEEPEEELPPEKKPRVIGSIDGNRVLSEAHPGAIYLHRAGQYQITRLDLVKRNCFARPVKVNYYTMPRKEKETEILAIHKSKPVRNFVVRLGELKVTETVVGYEKRRISGAERISVHELDLPPYSFETVGLWIEIDDFIPRAVARRRLNFMGGIHATEHAAIALFPLFALCERDDVGGISIPLHPQVEKAAVFIYDGYPGGVGLAEQAFQRIEDLLERTLSLLKECDCEEGCPACIHSPKCGSGNVPLDKEAAMMVLAMLLDKPEAREWIEMGKISDEPPDFEEEEEEPEPEPEKTEPRVLVFDLETRRSAAEVGGWNNAHLMGMAVAAVWDTRAKEMKTYTENQVDGLIRDLRSADLVVGFNIKGFDYKVLEAYDRLGFNKVPTFDMLYDVKHRLGYRLSLNHLAEHTLGAQKSADGLQSLEWVKQGRMDLVTEYCIHDVEITRDLFLHGLTEGWFRFQDKTKILLELSLDWDLAKIVEDEEKRTGRKR